MRRISHEQLFLLLVLSVNVLCCGIHSLIHSSAAAVSSVSPPTAPSSMHEQLGPSLRQPDTCPESLKHHLSLNYSLCQWASLHPLCSLIKELMSHCSCWPRLKERNAKPLLIKRKWKLVFSWLHGWLERWMNRGLPAGKGSGLVGVCMHVNVCFEAKRSAFVRCLRCPQVWLVWPLILSKCSMCPSKHSCRWTFM